MQTIKIPNGNVKEIARITVEASKNNMSYGKYTEMQRKKEDVSVKDKLDEMHMLGDKTYMTVRERMELKEKEKEEEKNAEEEDKPVTEEERQ